MCPACITTAALMLAGATSAGGLTAFAVTKLRPGTNAKGGASAVCLIERAQVATSAGNAPTAEPS